MSSKGGVELIDIMDERTLSEYHKVAKKKIPTWGKNRSGIFAH